jgi:hypothetical protein
MKNIFQQNNGNMGHLNAIVPHWYGNEKIQERIIDKLLASRGMQTIIPQKKERKGS